jgi:hypothetical protein
MKCLPACVAAMLIVLGIAGCQSTKLTVMSLENQEAAQPIEQMTTAPQKGTYYLYSSKEPDSARYHIDLKKGDEIGFRVSGNRAQAVAKGVLIELSEYSEGASYVWKVEPEKK